MHWRGTMQVSERGHLVIGGCDAVELAKTFGTPLYVIDEAAVREQCRGFRAGLRAAYPSADVAYAGKAFLTTAMCCIVAQEGLWLDVVSGGELHTAQAAGFPPERILFHGNNKSESELEAGVAAGVGRFVVDNLLELERLDAIAARSGARAGVILRITPGVSAHTHSYISTGQIDSKFGFPIAGGVAEGAATAALACRRLDLLGFHCHIGSQIFELDAFEAAIAVMAEFMALMRQKHGFTARELDLGGGMGIRYHAEDSPVPPEPFATAIGQALVRHLRGRDLPLPHLFIEPGRSIVGEAGTTLYTVGAIKAIPGVRTYVSVDGGMGDNPRVSLYQARYEAAVANKAGAAPMQTVSIAGKCCEQGDMLIWDLAVPEVLPGDILAVFSTGAYHYSMASNYNRLPRPACVLVGEGRADLIVRRERYEDLLACDLVPARLAPGGMVAEGGR